MKFFAYAILTLSVGFVSLTPPADALFYRFIPEGCMGPEDPFCGGNNDPWRDTNDTGESWCFDCYWSQSGDGGFACGQIALGYTGRSNCDTHYYGSTPDSCTPFGNFCENSVVTP